MRKVEEAKERLDELTPELTELQRLFLNARRETGTDGEAADKADVAQATVSRWKKQPLFKEAYQLICGVLNADTKQLSIPKEVQAEIVQGQVERMKAVLPELLEEAIDLALNAESESVKARMLIDVFDRLGVSSEDLGNRGLPGGKFMQYVQIFSPMMNALSEKEKRKQGEAIQGVYTEIDKEKD